MSSQLEIDEVDPITYIANLDGGRRERLKVIQQVLNTCAFERATSGVVNSGHDPLLSYSDAIASFKPDVVKTIVERKKNHDFRECKIHPAAARIYVYESWPTLAITHLAIIGPPKYPGQLEDPSGIGNEDFDVGTLTSTVGYPILGLYKLSRSVGRRELRERFHVEVGRKWKLAPKELVNAFSIATMTKLL